MVVDYIPDPRNVICPGSRYQGTVAVSYTHLYYWDPVIAPSGMLFYTGNLFPAWKGSLFIGALQGKHLVRLTLEGKLVVGEERLLEGLGKRIRDVVQGPDGAVYLVTDESVASVLKLVPKSG